MLGRLIGAAGIGVVGLAALAWWVLESSGVAVVDTQDPDGGVRSTHVWYARTADAVWLEAGRPEHPWYLDVQRDPRLTVRVDDFTGSFDAATVPGEQGHDHVRALLRAKYGLRDRILGWVIDTSPSIAVRLSAAPGTDLSSLPD